MIKTLPPDIEAKVKQLCEKADQVIVISLLLSLWDRPLNVGPEQLSRSLLDLSDGDVDIIRNITHNEFEGDPRDIIMQAERKFGNPGHYFIAPFDGF